MIHLYSQNKYLKSFVILNALLNVINRKIYTIMKKLYFIIKPSFNNSEKIVTKKNRARQKKNLYKNDEIIHVIKIQARAITEAYQSTWSLEYELDEGRDVILVVLGHVLQHEFSLLQLAVVAPLLRVLVEARVAKFAQLRRVRDAGGKGRRRVVHHLAVEISILKN